MSFTVSQQEDFMIVKMLILKWLVAWGRMLYGLIGVLTLGAFMKRPGWIETAYLNCWLTLAAPDQAGGGSNSEDVPENPPGG